ncbi:N-formylglutamate amidohydrolase [Verrucomicrobiales bacterium]|nr:N-formylglutamate amidohydrolase [Verrucomicrobiales bacterium]
MIQSIRHIPHSSTAIPEPYREQFLLSDEELDRELLQMTDRYTDELFGGDAEGALVFPVSRLLVDVERFEDDDQEIMASRGMGVLYTKAHDLRSLRREPTPEEREDLLSRYYRPHHEKLERMVDHSLEKFGHALVIDCHSFPSRRLPYEIAAEDDTRPEICIGTDSFHTPAWLRESAVGIFAEAGFQVDVDTPFSGALVPSKHYGRDERVHALMIEVRRDLYMDEETGKRSARFAGVRKMVRTAIERLEEMADTRYHETTKEP